MRHKKNMVKLGRTAEERKALLSSMVANLIEEQRITTTLAKAKQTRMLAEKTLTMAKKALAAGTPVALMQGKRNVLAVVRHRKHMDKLFEAIAPQFKDRAGGYTRITKLGRRGSDSSEMAILEWVGLAPVSKRRKPAVEAAVTPDAEPKKDA